MKLVLAFNKDLKHRFTEIESIEAGIELLGYEVKAIKAKQVDIEASYVRFKQGEAFIHNMFVKSAGPWSLSQTRPRKLLLHKKEIVSLQSKAKQKGLTVLPAELYLNERGLIKVRLSLVKAKKAFEKRQQLKERDLQKQISRYFKR